ncbi:MAG: ATPase [Defluviitaleaceae bacterium]|nr:ATPase [Defluviitaleaceae bacterium]
MDQSAMEKYLVQIEDVLENAKTVPFSSKVSVDKEQVYEILDEIRLNLPNELKESKKLIENKDRFLRDAEKRSESALESAQAEATAIIEDAETRALRLVSEHEIYKRAMEEAEILVEEAQRDSRSVRLNSMEYADEMLTKAETVLRQTLENADRQHSEASLFMNKILDTLFENRQELRGGSKN